MALAHLSWLEAEPGSPPVVAHLSWVEVEPVAAAALAHLSWLEVEPDAVLAPPAIVSVAPTTTGATVTYSGTATHYRVDGGAAVAVPSNPFTFAGLAPNTEPHTVELSGDGGSTWPALETFGTLNPGSGSGDIGGTPSQHESGGGAAVVAVSAAGGGTWTDEPAGSAFSGGGAAVVAVSAAGGGQAAEAASGSGQAVVAVSAAGGGFSSEESTFFEAVRLTSRITTRVSLNSLFSATELT